MSFIGCNKHKDGYFFKYGTQFNVLEIPKKQAFGCVPIILIFIRINKNYKIMSNCTNFES